MPKILRFVDHFGNLTENEARALQCSGVEGIFGYLCAKTHPGWGKGITKDALDMYIGIGWKVCFNFEGDPTHPSYFTSDQGKRDAEDVLTEFEYLGIKPTLDIAAYMSVDYDAHLISDFEAVDSYFVSVGDALGGKFAPAAYGGEPILQYLAGKEAKSKVQKFWQTVAWSGGRLFPHRNLYQGRVNTTIDGVAVDVDDVLVNPGYYPVDKPVQPAVPTELRYRITLPNLFNDLQHATEVALDISKLGVAAKVEEA